MWHAWMTAVAVLGLTTLEASVRAAFADGRIAQHWCDEDDFDALLEAAIEGPNDRTRLEGESMGYIDDVIVALEKFATGDDDFGDPGDDFDADSEEPEDLPDRLATTLPATTRIAMSGATTPARAAAAKNSKSAAANQRSG